MVKIRIGSGLQGVFSKLNPFKSLRPKGVLPEFIAEGLSAQVHGRKLAQYAISPAEVFISHDGKVGYYEVSEPGLSEREKGIYRDLYESFIYNLEPEAVESKDILKYVEGAIWKAAEDLGLLEEVRKSFSKYRYFIERDGLGYGKLHVPMLDPGVAEITSIGYTEPIYVVHRNFADLNWLQTNISFHSEAELQNFNLRLAQRLGKALTAAVPMVDVMTSEGHRISLTFGDEITHPGSTFSIRKFPQKPFSLTYLIAHRMLSPFMAAYVWEILERKGFVQMLGSVGSGKTTLLQAFLASVDPNAKIITVEDVMELNLPQKNWQRFHTRPVHFATSERFKVDLFDLIKLVMRHRPDYVAVGEVRGEEIRTLTHAASVVPETPILIREKGVPRLVPIGQVVDGFYEKDASSAPNPVSGIEVLTLDKSRGRAVFKEIKYVYRHTADVIYTIRYVGGSVKATGNHSVFVLDEKTLEIRSKRVSELSAGDILISFVKRESLGNVRALDLADYVSGQFKSNGKTIAPVHSGCAIPKVLNLNDCARALGVYLADGCSNGDSRSIIFTLGKNKLKKYVDSIERMATSLGLTPHFTDRGSYVHIYLYSLILQKAFENGFGKRALEKHVPPHLFLAPQDTIREFLDGHLADKGSRINSHSTASQAMVSDLCWLARIGGLSATIGYQKHSKGKNKGKTYFNVDMYAPERKGNGKGKLIPLSPFQQLAEVLDPPRPENKTTKPLTNYFTEKRRRFITHKTARRLLNYVVDKHRKEMTPQADDIIGRINWFLSTEIEITMVKSIEKSPYGGFVYDVSVPDTEAFFGGRNPVLLHNSLGHSCASTFHSFSPEAALARMRAHPIDLRDADILQIWCMPIAVRLRRPSGEIVYRVNGIYEINQTREGKPGISTIFEYNARTDSFSPDSVSEVIKRSRRLREAAEAQGTSKRELTMILQHKVKFFEDMIKHKELEFEQYVENIKNFYARRYE